jgi:TRAP-type C4-dicarboxylate transport system permease small subunit
VFPAVAQEGIDVPGFLKALDRNAERWALLVFYVLLVVTMAVEVLRREAFSYSSIWGEEVVRYSFIYLAWIGAASAVRERAHIRIDVIMHYLGPRMKALLYMLGDLVMFSVAWLRSTGLLKLSRCPGNSGPSATACASPWSGS